MRRRHAQHPDPAPSEGRPSVAGPAGAASERGDRPDCSQVRWETTADCRHCPIRQQALFAALRGPDFEHILTPIRNAVIPAGTRLYREDTRRRPSTPSAAGCSSWSRAGRASGDSVSLAGVRASHRIEILEDAGRPWRTTDSRREGGGL